MNSITLNTEEAMVPFSESGIVDERTRALVKKVNPFYAINNCPVAAFKTAYLLEKGKLPHLTLKNPSRPRPMAIIELRSASWTRTLFENLESQRTHIYIRSISKEDLENLMKRIGKGTHAVIGAPAKRLFDGHAFNYALQNDGRFLNIDGYSYLANKLSANYTNFYWKYFNTENLEATLFFNINDESATAIRDLHKSVLGSKKFVTWPMMPEVV